MSTSASEQNASAPASSKPERVKRSLIVDGEPWDRYHLDSILPLREQYPNEKEFGFLLRHYWMPATQLQYRQSSRWIAPDGTVKKRNVEIHRKMARCRSNECLWREKVLTIKTLDGSATNSSDATEELCSYDCYDQAFRTRAILSHGPYAPVDISAARRQALYRMPMLVPPGPIPFGFSWYTRIGDDHMNYQLETEEYAGETSVLIIRREGRYTLWLPEASKADIKNPRHDALYFHPRSNNFVTVSGNENANTMTRVITERKGVTLFSSNRCVVLEDRYFDSVVAAEGPWASLVGITNQMLIRLVHSVPTSDVSQPEPFTDDNRGRVSSEHHCFIK